MSGKTLQEFLKITLMFLQMADTTYAYATLHMDSGVAVDKQFLCQRNAAKRREPASLISRKLIDKHEV